MPAPVPVFPNPIPMPSSGVSVHPWEQSLPGEVVARVLVWVVAVVGIVVSRSPELGCRDDLPCEKAVDDIERAEGRRGWDSRRASLGVCMVGALFGDTRPEPEDDDGPSDFISSLEGPAMGAYDGSYAGSGKLFSSMALSKSCKP